MKKLLLRWGRLFALLFLVFASLNAGAQACGVGYTRDTLNWDYLDFLPNTGTSYTSFINLAKSQTQWFTFGTQAVKVTHNYSGANDPGEDGTNTAESNSFGNGDDVHFIGNGAVTFTFNAAVLSAKFSIYDIDRSQKVTITASNGATPVLITTLAKVSGSVLTIAGSGTASASATASNTSVANTSTDGTANVTITGPLTSMTITVTNTGTASGEDGSFWISDLSACSSGTMTTNYYNVSKPYTGMPTYVLAVEDDSVFYINVANGKAKFLFTDPGWTNMNSMAYDPVRHMVYYTYSLTSSAQTDLTLRRYDYEKDTLGVVHSNVNNLGVPTYEAGVESGAAAFYNGSLYLGIEGYAPSGSNSGRESAVWKMDFNASYAPTGVYAQVYATPGDDGAGSILHDWADFGINDGTLYDFDGASGNTDFYHKDMLTGSTVHYTPSPSTLIPRQVAVDWTGKLYNIGSPNSVSSGTIEPYNNNGTINSAQQYTITYNGVDLIGSWGDAAEAFLPKTDFGDAPASYDPSGSDPALHEVTTKLRLGNNVDIEFAKKTSANASGDLYDDGIIGSPTVITHGTWNVLQAVKVYNNTGANATLIGWIDANADGVFQASEGVSATVSSSASIQTINLYWANLNTTALNGTTTFMRLRVTSASYGMTTSKPNGYYEDGEVEDYQISVLAVLAAGDVTFTAQKASSTSAKLSWHVGNQINYSKYELQRSADGQKWEPIYLVNASGSLEGNFYFTDRQPHSPASYYRVEIYTTQGGVVYTETKKLDFNSYSTISVSPNPARSNVTVRVNSTVSGLADLEFIDYTGKLVYSTALTVTKGTNEIPLTIVSRLNSGMYKVKVIINGEILYTTLMVSL